MKMNSSSDIITSSSVLEIPNGVKLYEHAMGTYWFDEDGILYAVAKNEPRTLETVKDNIAFLKKLLNNKPVCLIADATKTTPYDKETRDYLASELKNVYKSMAIISTSALGRTIANTFIILHLIKPLPVPMKMFANATEAKEWVKEYL